MALISRSGGGGGGGAGGAGGNAGCVLVITSAESPIGSGRTPLGTFTNNKTITDGSLKVKFESFTAATDNGLSAEGGSGGARGSGGTSPFGTAGQDGAAGNGGRDGIAAIIFL
tara:strand:+ start:93 stop:431 length:339 start_codon:yes stop_codon:yes gene_type:complete